jgi:hypothetical protein
MEPERSPPNTKDVDPILEYRLASMLLSLVATINKDGRENKWEYNAVLEKSQAPHLRVMNALAQALPRDNEVVAITVSGILPHGPNAARKEANTLAILVMQEGESEPTKLVPSFRHFTMIPNTRWDDPPATEWLTVIRPGESKWTKIKDSPWHCEAKPYVFLVISIFFF